MNRAKEIAKSEDILDRTNFERTKKIETKDMTEFYEVIDKKAQIKYVSIIHPKAANNFSKTEILQFS